MRNQDRLKLLTVITENNDFLERIKRIREQFYFPQTGFASKKVFQELNSEFRSEPAHGITRQDMEAHNIAAIFQARVTDEQIDEAVTSLIDKYGLDHGDYTKSVIGDFLIYGKVDFKQYDPRAQWAAEWYYDQKTKRWRNYFYFLINKSTRRDSFRSYWKDQQQMIKKFKSRLPKDAPLMLVALNEGAQCVEVYISRNTTRTYIEDHWNQIEEKQRLLIGYEKQRPADIGKYIRVSKDNSIGIKKNTVKTIRRNIRKITSSSKSKNRG